MQVKCSSREKMGYFGCYRLHWLLCTIWINNYSKHFVRLVIFWGSRWSTSPQRADYFTSYSLHRGYWSQDTGKCDWENRTKCQGNFYYSLLVNDYNLGKLTGGFCTLNQIWTCKLCRRRDFVYVLLDKNWSFQHRYQTKGLYSFYPCLWNKRDRGRV